MVATMVKLALALYVIVGLGWSGVISTQRAAAGWDPLDGVFLVRAVLRALSWPVDAAVVTGLPVVGIAGAFVLAVALLSAVAPRNAPPGLTSRA